MKKNIKLHKWIRQTLLVLPLILIAVVSAILASVPVQVQAGDAKLMALEDTSTVSGDDIIVDDDDIYSSLTQAKESKVGNTSRDSLQPFTLQGTKASTLRSRAVYIVNGKKRIKK